jgi:hypothetical protein
MTVRRVAHKPLHLQSVQVLKLFPIFQTSKLKKITFGNGFSVMRQGLTYQGG